MTATLTNPGNLWQRVIDSHQQYVRAFNDFLNNSSDRIDVLREALRGRDRLLALQTVPSLDVEDRKALFPEWVDLARAAHSPFQIAWNVIESLPREWVLENIEEHVQPILRNADETDYWMFLQLYVKLDERLTKALAQRAAHHADGAIRELGEEYLARIQGHE